MPLVTASPIVGVPIDRRDGRLKVMGRAKYAAEPGHWGFDNRDLLNSVKATIERDGPSSTRAFDRPEDLKRDLQGESVTVELHEANGHVADARRVLAELTGDVHVDGVHVRARVPNGAEAIPRILGALDDAGIPVAAVTTARPSLDDVYLHYTGRDFTSEDEGRA